MTGDATARVHYFQGQFLHPQDFADEQTYQLALHRRHAIGQHDWGIVAGLELIGDKEGNLYVNPGVAVDRFGRELVLAERQGLPGQVFADRGSDVLDVYLNYNRVGAAASADPAACGDGGADAFYRWHEQPFLTFEVGDDPFADRRQPGGVLPGDRGFDPSRTPPDEPERRWPVFLGQISYHRANTKQPYTVDLAGRPYVGLVGESVAAPSGRATIQVGSERKGDRNRFAVFVPEAETATTAGQPRLAIIEDGTVGIRGDTTLTGNLTVLDHAIELQAGAKHPAGRHPAQLYHLANDSQQELRIEMAAPGAAGPHQVVIGAWSKTTDPTGGQKEQFNPCLTVANDCTVTIHGNLVVEGTIDDNALAPATITRVDAGLSDEAKRLAGASFTSGVTGGGALLGAVYKSPFPPPPAILASPAAVMAAAPEEGMLAAATTVAASQDRLETFARLLRAEHPDTADRLRQALQPPAAPASGEPPTNQDTSAERPPNRNGKNRGAPAEGEGGSS